MTSRGHWPRESSSSRTRSRVSKIRINSVFKNGGTLSIIVNKNEKTFSWCTGSSGLRSWCRQRVIIFHMKIFLSRLFSTIIIPQRQYNVHDNLINVTLIRRFTELQDSRHVLISVQLETPMTFRKYQRIFVIYCYITVHII